MQKRALGCLMVLAGTVSLAAPPALPLFSAEEAAAWNRRDQPPGITPRELPQPGVPNCHAAPATAAHSPADPQINIVAPVLGKPLSPPLDIDVQFVAAGPAIRPDTFRVCYMGFITVDITKRITEHVAVSPQGLHVSGADLPHGHHHLLMMIADAQGHFGTRDATFEIQ